ncbi:MAG: helicase-associated domain-containing protein [Gemmatimonadota bacterium]
MHHFEIDWFEFAGRAAVWRHLARQTRATLLGNAPSEAIRLDSVGPDRELLLAESFVAVSGTGRAALHPLHRPHARALRAMSRHDILGHPTRHTLADYMRDQYTAAERQRLGGEHAYYRPEAEHLLLQRLMSAEWVRDALLLAADRAAPTRTPPARPDRMLVLELETAQRRSRVDAARIVAAVLEQGGHASIDELPALVAELVPAVRFSAALGAALSEAWLFATISPADRMPVVTLWPGIVARLQRRASTAPAPVEPVEHYCSAFLADDTAAVLVEAAAEPLRLRGNDFAIYARATKRLEAALAPTPPWTAKLTNWSAEVRIDQAIHFASRLSLLQTRGEAGRDLRLEATAAARAWLAGTPAGRLRTLIDLVRPVHEDRAPRKRRRGGRSSNDGPGLFSMHVRPAELRSRAERAASKAFGTLPDDGAVHAIAFIEHCARIDDPLEGALAGHPEAYVDMMAVDLMTEEQREYVWADLLASILLNRLVPLGGAVLGRLPDGGVGIGITPAGRYLLGLTETFDAAGLDTLAVAGGAAPQILVQPNFDVVFLTPSPLGEAEIGRFAERTGTNVGTLFRITRDAVHNAAGAGLDGAAALASLRSLSSQPIPQNVEREVAGWFNACRRVTAAPALLLRCPDEETAARALAAAGRALTRIAPTILEVRDPRKRSDLVRRLRRQGIFVDG